MTDALIGLEFGPLPQLVLADGSLAGMRAASATLQATVWAAARAAGSRLISPITPAGFDSTTGVVSDRILGIAARRHGLVACELAARAAARYWRGAAIPAQLKIRWATLPCGHGHDYRTQFSRLVRSLTDGLHARAVVVGSRRAGYQSDAFGWPAGHSALLLDAVGVEEFLTGLPTPFAQRRFSLALSAFMAWAAECVVASGGQLGFVGGDDLFAAVPTPSRFLLDHLRGRFGRVPELNETRGVRIVLLDTLPDKSVREVLDDCRDRLFD